MSLLKTVVKENGIEISYWKIQEIHFSVERQAVIILEGYLNQEKKNENQPLDTYKAIFTWDQFNNAWETNNQKTGYILVKTLEDFTNSQDI